jgi:tetratricopeptide (TPR) repeat protein
MTPPPDKTAHRKELVRSGWSPLSGGLQRLNSQRDYIFTTALILGTLFAYRPVWHGTPLMDDQAYLITTPELRSVSGLVRIWAEPQTAPQEHLRQYHPLVNTVFWLGNRLWGDAMLGYHLANIFLHSVSALLLWKILRQLEIAGAWLAAALFALHPVQVDSVAWLAELKNTLSGVFFFGCILAYLRFDQTRNRGAYALALLLFCLGLLAKAIVAMAAVVLPILFWWKRGRLQWKRDFRPLIPFVFLAIVSGFATAWMERKFAGAEGEAFAFSFVERLLIAGRAFWFYLTKALWPSDLLFVYPRWEVNSQTWRQYLFPIAAVCLFALAWMLRKRWSWLFAGLLVFGAILFPMLGFFNIVFFRLSFVSDHFQYLAILGIIVPVSAGGAILLKRLDGAYRVAGYALVFALLGTLAVSTSRHSAMYHDNITCWKIVLERNPSHWMSQVNRASELLQKGDLDGALACFEIALQKSPRNLAIRREISRNICDVFSKKGMLDEAIAQFEKCLAMSPDFAEAHHDLANALRKKGRYLDAVAHYESALRIDPRSVLTLNNLGWLLATCSDPSVRNGARAVEVAARAELLSGGEDPLILHTLAAAYAENGQFSQAVATAQRALQLAEQQKKGILLRALPNEITLYRAELPYHEPSR